MAYANADYVILEDQSSDALSSRVRELIQKNYVPQGGVVVVALGGDGYLYAQAMVFNVDRD